MSTSKLGMLRVTIPGLLVLLLCEAVEKFQHIMILIYNQDLFYCEREKRLVWKKRGVMTWKIRTYDVKFVGCMRYDITFLQKEWGVHLNSLGGRLTRFRILTLFGWGDTKAESQQSILTAIYVVENLGRLNLQLKFINSTANLSAARSASCRHISAIFKSFLTPTARRPSSWNPACCKSCIARAWVFGSGKSLTALITTSKLRSVEIGGTRISAANVSDIPMSCNMDRLDDVAKTSKRWFLGGLLPSRTIKACKTPLENRGPMGTQSVKKGIEKLCQLEGNDSNSSAKVMSYQEFVRYYRPQSRS